MDSTSLERLLIREIRRTPGTSRRDLSDRLEVARSTAGRRVDSLIKQGLLQETGVEQKSEAGRPKRQLDLRGDHGNFIGFDFDARNIYATLVDFAQNTLEQSLIPLNTRPHRDEVLDHLRETIAQFMGHPSGRDILGIGIGTPGHIRQQERLAVSYPYIAGWKDVNFCSELNLSPDDLHIDQNTRATALSEYWLGGPSLVENLICINIRTGISSAIISDGRLIRGGHEMAGEIRGWTVMSESSDGPSPAWLEDEATVRAISPTRNISSEGWDEFVMQCQEGQRPAIDTLSRLAKIHADVVTRLVQVTDPEVVVFSGAFNQLGEMYLEKVREALAISLLGHYISPPPLRFVSLGHFAGAHGAAAMVAEHFKPAQSALQR